MSDGGGHPRPHDLRAVGPPILGTGRKVRLVTRPPRLTACAYPIPRTVVATKQQQARRYAELYGLQYQMDPYGRRGLLMGGNRQLFHRGGLEDEVFWDEFETGRRGAYLEAQRERAHADAFFRLQVRLGAPRPVRTCQVRWHSKHLADAMAHKHLADTPSLSCDHAAPCAAPAQILQMLLAERGRGIEYEEEDDDDGEEEGEEELEMLSAQAAFYEEERNCSESGHYQAVH